MKGYGTFTYALKQFTHTCPTNTGKDSSDVDTSLPLSAVTYLNIHAQYFAVIDLTLKL